jgi:hypothetical protein
MSDHVDTLGPEQMMSAHRYVDNYYRLVEDRDIGPMTDAMVLDELDKVAPGGAAGWAEADASRALTNG